MNLRAWVYLGIGLCAGLLAGFIMASGGGGSARMSGKIVQNEWDLLIEGRQAGKALVIDETSYVALREIAPLAGLDIIQQENQLLLFQGPGLFRRPQGIGLDDVERRMNSAQRRMRMLDTINPERTAGSELAYVALQAELAVYTKWKTELELEQTNAVDPSGGSK